MVTYVATYCGDCMSVYQYHMWFFVENNTSGTISADFSSVNSQLSFSDYAVINSITNNESSFYVEPFAGGLLSIPSNSTLTFRGPTYGNETLQIGSAPLLTINGQTLDFWFWNSDELGDHTQYINLIGNNGFTVTTNTSIQNTVTGNDLIIGLGGCGGNLSTTNICIQVYELPLIYGIDPNLLFAVPPPPVPEPSGLGLLLLGVTALARWRQRSERWNRTPLT
jgi:hypothetical protein